MPHHLPLLETVATPALWTWTLAGVLALFAVDFVITRRPHEVSTREAVGWSAFYIALPLAFGGWIWATYGGDTGLAFLSGYVVEKSLSVDNLFVFMLLLGGFAVPRVLQQRVLLIGVAGALVMRAVFIALGAVLLARFSVTFLVFGLILLVSAVKVWRDAVRGHDDEPDVGGLAVVRWIRRVLPVSEGYRGTAL
ncbi:MAG TPA: TerC family protein, partial [Propionibacteriaceae bacterium]|nr:TerC family protein [Propionibacteriaceae bacterium]